jgi:hypothetical protein
MKFRGWVLLQSESCSFDFLGRLPTFWAEYFLVGFLGKALDWALPKKSVKSYHRKRPFATYWADSVFAQKVVMAFFEN